MRSALEFVVGLICGALMVGVAAVAVSGSANVLDIDAHPHVEFRWSSVELESIVQHKQFWTQAELRTLVQTIRMRQRQLEPLAPPVDPSQYRVSH